MPAGRSVVVEERAASAEHVLEVRQSRLAGERVLVVVPLDRQREAVARRRDDAGREDLDVDGVASPGRTSLSEVCGW